MRNEQCALFRAVVVLKILCAPQCRPSSVVQTFPSCGFVPFVSLRFKNVVYHRAAVPLWFKLSSSLRGLNFPFIALCAFRVFVVQNVVFRCAAVPSWFKLFLRAPFRPSAFAAKNKKHIYLNFLQNKKWAKTPYCVAVDVFILCLTYTNNLCVPLFPAHSLWSSPFYW